MEFVRPALRPWPKVARFVVAVLALLALACGGPPDPAEDPSASGGPAEAAPPRESVPVEVRTVFREPLSQLYSTSATLRAEKRATVTARTRGVVERLLVEEGDRVAARQELARLENDEQTIAFERARTTRDNLRREVARLEELHGQSLVSDEEYEAKRREADDAEQAFALAELELERTVIRAPFAGVVLERHLDPGGTVSDGTPIYDLADDDPLYADISVPERHVVRLRPGQTVRLTADASAVTAEAAIERIAPSVDPTSGTVKVTLTVPSHDGLRPGSFVRTSIVTDTHEEALVIPRSALVAEGRRWLLYRVLDDGETVEQLEIELGYEEGERVEVAAVVGEGELAVGDRVVTAGAPALAGGARIEIHGDAEGPTADGAA